MSTPNGDSQLRTPAEFRLIGRLGGLSSWANTVNRGERMRAPHRASPGGLAWHAKKLGLDPDDLTPDEQKRVEAAHAAYWVAMSEKAQRARKRRKAERLRAQAAELDRQADLDDD